MDSVVTDAHLIQTFFLVPAESPLISMCDNAVRVDSVSTGYHLLQTSFPIPTLRTRWYNRLIEITTKASMLI